MLSSLTSCLSTPCFCVYVFPFWKILSLRLFCALHLSLYNNTKLAVAWFSAIKSRCKYKTEKSLALRISTLPHLLPAIKLKIETNCQTFSFFPENCKETYSIMSTRISKLKFLHMITYKLESHLDLIKIFTRDFYFRDFVDFCLISIFGAAFLVTSPTVCAVIWWQQCTYLWTLHCTLLTAGNVRQRILATLLVDAIKEKYLCTQNFHWNNSGVELQTMWWILLLFQLSSHYGLSSIGLLPNLLLIIVSSANFYFCNKEIFLTKKDLSNNFKSLNFH